LKGEKEETWGNSKQRRSTKRRRTVGRRILYGDVARARYIAAVTSSTERQTTPRRPDAADNELGLTRLTIVIAVTVDCLHRRTHGALFWDIPLRTNRNLNIIFSERLRRIISVESVRWLTYLYGATPAVPDRRITLDLTPGDQRTTDRGSAATDDQSPEKATDRLSGVTRVITDGGALRRPTHPSTARTNRLKDSILMTADRTPRMIIIPTLDRTLPSFKITFFATSLYPRHLFKLTVPDSTRRRSTA